MNRGTYIAANGMIAQQQRLDTVANNLANVNTAGFKGDRLTFGDMMLRTLADDAGYGSPIATLSSGPEIDSKAAVTDFSPGAMQETGNPLDLGLGGKTLAMFAVRHDGQTAYTRNGAFRLDASDDLVTGDGDPVLDDKGRPIRGLSGGKVEIGPDGRIAGTDVTVGRFVGRFHKGEKGAGLYEGDARPATAADDAPIASRHLEASNVNPVLAMTDLISLQRAYEISQKMVQSQDESTAKLAETIG